MAAVFRGRPSSISREYLYTTGIVRSNYYLLRIIALVEKSCECDDTHTQCHCRTQTNRTVYDCMQVVQLQAVAHTRGGGSRQNTGLPLEPKLLLKNYKQENLFDKI